MYKDSTNVRVSVGQVHFIQTPVAAPAMTPSSSALSAASSAPSTDSYEAPRPRRAVPYMFGDGIVVYHQEPMSLAERHEQVSNAVDRFFNWLFG